MLAISRYVFHHQSWNVAAVETTISFGPRTCSSNYSPKTSEITNSPLFGNDAHIAVLVARHQFHTAPIFFRCSSTRAESVSSSLVSVGSGVA